jgi:hypothetical protein
MLISAAPFPHVIPHVTDHIHPMTSPSVASATSVRCYFRRPVLHVIPHVTDLAPIFTEKKF